MKINVIRFIGILSLGLLFGSCGTSKAGRQATNHNSQYNQKIIPPDLAVNFPNAPQHEAIPEDYMIYSITSFAREYEGTPYKYGGTTREGMDCSGLVYTSFLHHDIPLPRSSRDMALKGTELSLTDVSIGDLLFFETDKRKKVINHVGLVVDIQPGQIFFIHSSSSRGVIVSSMAESYWNEHFVTARRVL